MTKIIHVVFEVEGKPDDIHGCLDDIRGAISDQIRPANYGVAIVGKVEISVKS